METKLNIGDTNMQHEDLNRRLMAAAVTEFAAMLKQAGFPKSVSVNHGGQLRAGIALPNISWSVFMGDRHQALEHIQTQGLSRQGNASDSAFQFLAEDMGKITLNS